MKVAEDLMRRGLVLVSACAKVVFSGNIFVFMYSTITGTDILAMVIAERESKRTLGRF